MITFTRCAFMAKQACATFSQVVQKITPPIANKFLKFFFALFAMLALGVTNAWGAEETYTYTFSSFSQGSPVEFTNTNPDLTITLKVAPSGQGNTTKPQWNSGSSQARVYAGGTMSIAIGSGTITKIVYNYVINASSGTKPTISGVEGTTSAGTWDGDTKTWTGSDTEVLFSTSGTKGNVGFKSFTITYSSSTASDQPTLSSIEISGDLTKKTYEEGDELDLAGLTVNAIYDDASTKVVTNDVEWSYTPALTKGLTSVEVTATYEGLEVSKTINDLTVTEHVVTPGEYCTGKLGYTFWGLSAEKTTAAANEVDYTRMFNDITINIKNGAKTNAYFKEDHTRVYSGGYTMTFTAPVNYVITAISFTPDAGNTWAGTHTANVGTMTDSKNWAGSANEVTITFEGTCRITDICVTYEAAPVEPTKTLTRIEITTPATQTTFWQGETFNYNGLVVTAHYSDAADEVVTPTVTGSTATDGTATVNVSYKEQSTSYNITVKAIPNTKETAYTVADAYDIIDKLTTANGVFISGTISQIDSYSDPYKSITYWISADGTTTKQLQVYSGKGLESADFAAVTDLSVGDQVIVCGNLKKYSGTYEFDKNNYLASHTPTTKDPAGLAYATTSYTANVGEPFTTPDLTNPHNLGVTYATSDASKATVDVNTGAVTIVAAGEVTITASTTGDATHDAGSASYTITISNPAMAVATLPFAFNGDKAAIEATAGMTQNGLGSDYSASTAPNSQLKFDGTGDWVIIHFNGQAEKLAYEIKGNGFSGGKFTVQQSADGSAYTDVVTYTELGDAATKEHELAAESRYVKFIYTEKSSGNVGLGNIKITEPDLRQEASLAWNPTSVTLTQGEAFTVPTLNNPYSVSGITYKSSNDEVATVTAEGEIALASAIGTATITATFDGDVTYKPATATCTITVNEYIETIDGEWELVTDASKLQAGMEIIIASVEVDGKYYAMSKASDNGNNRTAVESTISGDKLNPAVGTSVLTLVDAGNGTFALQAGNGNYLYAASSSANQLKEKNKIDVNGQWTITIADNVATIKAEASSYRNWMQFNPNNGSPLFSCYAYNKPQKDIALYAKVPEHRRTTSAGRYGTICLPGNIVKCLGATLYEVAGKDGLRVVFDEVLTPEAGMPYIFLAHNAEVLFYCGDQTAAAGNYNSLYGTFSVLQDAQLDGMYMVQNNKIVKCAATGCGVAENRAYFNGSELDVLGKPGAQMPGRRRITMGTESENTATGTEDVIAPEGQTLKLIENGQLVIIRNGEKYNAQGQKL